MDLILRSHQPASRSSSARTQRTPFFNAADPANTPRLIVAPPDRITAPAAVGAFSEVWPVRDEAGRRYALKRLRGELRGEPQARRLIAREAEALQAVRSRYVVRLIGVSRDGDCPALLLEWLDGRSLEDGLRDGTPLGLRQTLWIARQCAQGLADLGRSGFAHGDFKPENVMLTPAGEVKLIDLGFARRTGRAESGGDDSGAGERPLTGTPEYLAPEALSRGPFDPSAADVYGFGVVLFRMLAGRLPFEDGATGNMLRRHRQARPPRLSDVRPEAPEELVGLVARLLAKQPLRRPRLQELVRELTILELQSLPGGGNKKPSGEGSGPAAGNVSAAAASSRRALWPIR